MNLQNSWPLPFFMVLLFSATPAYALQNGLASSPPMGFNTWNAFHCDVSESIVRNMADIVASSGLRDAGYNYIVVDDCWASGRAANNQLQADASKFPSGIAALATYVHGKNLKFGLYTSAGPTTCQGRPGSYGYEALDMSTFAQWGVDFVKIDWCNPGALVAKTQFPLFTQAVAATARPMLVSISNSGADNVAMDWGPSVANMWRTNGDLKDSWLDDFGVMTSVYSNARFQTAAAPNGWNDLDMLQVGNGGMSLDEEQSHYSLWVVEASPLMIGFDLTKTSASVMQILNNPEAIAISQDANGNQGLPSNVVPGSHSVWTRTLSNGSRAVVLLNEGAAPQDVTVNFAMIGLSANTSYPVRDIVNRKDLGSFQNTYVATALASHASAFVVVGKSLAAPVVSVGTGTTTGTTSGGSSDANPSSPAGSNGGDTVTPELSPGHDNAGCAQSNPLEWMAFLQAAAFAWRAARRKLA